MPILYQGSIKAPSRLSHGYLKAMPVLYQGSIKALSRLSQDYLKNLSRISLSRLETPDV
jgi:hypothetical protein